MILDRVLALYDTEPDLLKRREPGKGNPTASAAGTCAAQLQMLRFPHLTKPERRSARSAMVLEDGDMHAEDMKRKVRRAFPGMTGLAEELFYFRVPVDAAQEQRLVEKIADRSLWGTVLRGFVPPRIALGRNGEKDRVRLAPRDERKPDRPRPLGFVVDPGTCVLWVPLYLDHVARVLAVDRLMVIEYKSMSRFSFRRAVMGDMGYKERAQLAVIADALGLDTLWLLKAKDTAHHLEVTFLADADAAGRTRVTITRTSGQKDTYWVAPDRRRAVNEATGEVVDELREEESWDFGEVWTPYDRSLLDQVRARILRVLLYEPPADPVARLHSWDREYGPDFACGVCDGTGTQTRQKNRAEPLKKPKPCEDCGATGALAEVQLLAFPCGYCACVLSACYPMARLEVTDKPRYYVKRGDYEAAGLTFTPPEGPAPTRITVDGGAPPAGAPGAPGAESTAAPSPSGPVIDLDEEDRAAGAHWLSGASPNPLAGSPALPPSQPPLPLPTVPVRFALAGKVYETAGITRDQLIEAFRLASAVANRHGPNRSSTILATFGAANFLALTAERADLYLAALQATLEETA